MKTRKVIVETINGPLYVRSGCYTSGIVCFLKLTRSARYAARFTANVAEDFISGINASAAMGFYPQHAIQFAR